MDHPATLTSSFPRRSRVRQAAPWVAAAWPTGGWAATGLPVATWPGVVEWMVAAGVVVVGGALIWRTVRRLEQRKRQMEALLERTDCLLWRATVTLEGAGWTWAVTMEPTGLSRRLYDRLKPPEVGGLWNQFEVPQLPEMDRRCRAAIEGGEESYEQEFQLGLGEEDFWLHEKVSISPLGADRYSLVGLVTDVSARRRAEAAQRVNEERLQQLLSRSDCLLWQARVTGDPDVHTEWEWFIPDSELYRRLGGTRDPEPRMPWDRSLVPEYAELNARSMTALREGQPGYEQEFRLVKDGEVLWLREQVSVERIVPGEWRLQGMIVDQTAQRRAEAEKRASDQQLQQLLQTADFMLWHARVFRTAAGGYHWVQNVPNSTLYRRVFGEDPGQPPRMRWEKVVSAPGNLAMTRRAEQAFVGGATNYEQEIEARREGEVYWLHEQATVHAVAPGEWQVVGVVTDVTQRHQAEEARRGSERALREILERANCLLWRAQVKRHKDRLEWTQFELPVSRLSTDLHPATLGFDQERLWRMTNVPELAEMNERSTQAMLSGATGYEQEFRVEISGRKFWLQEHVTITADGDDAWRLVGVITDVTQGHVALEAQRKSEQRLQELLRRSDCMIWQGRVAITPGGHPDWQLYVPPSHLFRRIFGRDPSPGLNDGLDWTTVGVPELPAMVERSLNALISGATDYEQVFHIPKPEGAIWVTEQVSITRLSESTWECLGVITDITARREAEARLERILELADGMVWEAKVTIGKEDALNWQIYTTRSRLYSRLFGEREVAPALDWRKLNVPELPEMAARAHDALTRRASGYDQEFRVIDTEHVVWLREVVTITEQAVGEFRLVGVITDITAQREAQEAQRASVAQVEQMLEVADALLWQARVFEVAPGELRWMMFVPRSRLHRELFGRDPETPAGLPWDELLDPQTRKETNARAAEAIRGGLAAYEQEFRAQRGERVFWLHESATITVVGPGEWKIVGVLMDLTARREAVQLLRTSERRYRTLFQHTPIAILEADFVPMAEWLEELRRTGVVDLAAWFEAEPKRVLEAARRVRVLDCNDTAMTMLRARSKADFRRRRGVLASMDTMRWVRDMALAIWQRHYRLEAEIDMFDFEGGSHRVNVRWWMEQGGGEGDHPQAVVVLVDLTDLKRAEAALAAEKERLAVTLRAMAEGVVTTDVEGRVQFMNEAAAELTGWPPREAIGREVGAICHFESERNGEPIEVPVARVARGDVVIELPAGTRMMAQSGSGKLVEGCCAPVHSATSRVIGTVLVFRDVTEHERLEQELVRATKLESVGILAGGIAHDFNNILTAVMGNVALAALDIAADSDAGRSLAEAEKATLRARDLTQQLLTFAKGGEPVCTAVKLDGVVREVATFTLHGSKVRAHFEVPSDLWTANADKGQIGRVVQNLVLNAVQAMPDGGTVRIVLANELVAGLAQAALAPGNYVRIEIRDTGVGIKPEHLSRIFDPYFTTKQTGSGLGLAAVYSIVHKHHGTIEVESQLGLGSVFRLWLPASAEAAVGAGEGRPAAPVVMKGRVLFMDDEEPIRHMATFLLRRLGFEVVGAVDGADAIEKYRAALAEGQSFTLVIMDLTIPGGMGGKEAITHLQKLDPQVRAIVSSGYSSDPVLANFRANGFCGVVAKPYEIGELARVLREALAAVVK